MTVKDYCYLFLAQLLCFESSVCIFQLDGRDFFDMPQSKGKVTVKRTLDYDTMDRNYYMLNISVAVSQV